MKKLLCAMATLTSVAVILTSCSTGKNAVTNPKSSVENLKNEPTSGCYVQLNDGTVKKYGSLKLVTGVLVTPHLLADGKDKIFAGDIKSYLNNEHYAVSEKSLTGGRNSAIASETLPGFAVRVVKGRLNVYRKKFFNGQFTVDEFYLQSGDDGAILPYSAGLMTELVKANPEASKLIKGKKVKANAPKIIMSTAQTFNNESFVSRN